MRDGLPIRHVRLAALDVDVDPLEDARRLGALVDPFLGDLEPFAVAEVFADEPILDNADTLRQRLGDQAFFAALNETDGGGSSGDDGWGDLGGWDAARYDAARLQPVDGDDRRLLVQALLADLLSSYAEGAAANREGYVDIDSGHWPMVTRPSELAALLHAITETVR